MGGGVRVGGPGAASPGHGTHDVLPRLDLEADHGDRPHDPRGTGPRGPRCPGERLPRSREDRRTGLGCGGCHGAARGEPHGGTPPPLPVLLRGRTVPASAHGRDDPPLRESRDGAGRTLELLEPRLRDPGLHHRARLGAVVSRFHARRGVPSPGSHPDLGRHRPGARGLHGDALRDGPESDPVLRLRPSRRLRRVQQRPRPRPVRDVPLGPRPRSSTEDPHGRVDRRDAASDPGERAGQHVRHRLGDAGPPRRPHAPAPRRRHGRRPHGTRHRPGGERGRRRPLELGDAPHRLHLESPLAHAVPGGRAEARRGRRSRTRTGWSARGSSRTRRRAEPR